MMSRQKIEQEIEMLRFDLNAETYFGAERSRINSLISQIERLQHKLVNPEEYDSQFDYNPDRFACDRLWRD